jgi:streptogramin lyase
VGTVGAVAVMAAVLAPTASAKPGDLYITGNENGPAADVVRMNPRTGAVHDVATLPDNGSGDNAAFGKDGRLYVSDEDGNVVFRVNVSTGAVDVLSDPSFVDPWALDVGPTGRVLVGDYTAPSIFSLNPPSTSFTPLSSDGFLDRLNAIGFAPSGQIYLAIGPADTETVAQILKVSPVTGAQNVVGDLPGDGNGDFPDGLTVGPNGTVYVARETSIDRFLPRTRAASEVSSSADFSQLYDLELGFNGQLYVVDNGDKVIRRVNPRTGAVATVGDPGQNAPVGIAVQPPKCAGKSATVVGTQKKDKIKGSPGPDVIAGLGGNDAISGLGGGDRLCGGKGADKLIGGKSHDILRGGPGHDSQRQ